MAIEGPLRELGLHDVFQLLDLSRKTGVLRISSQLRHNDGTVYFDRGAIVYAEIRSNPQRLGEVLLRAGRITEADIERARTQQDREGHTRRLGRILVETGAVSERELARQVEFHLEESVFELMSWREGFFSFAEGELPATLPSDVQVRIPVEKLLMEGARRIDEWSRIEAHIPHLGMVPSLAEAGSADGMTHLHLLPEEWEVLAQVDGVRDVRHIAASVARPEFETAKTLFGLVATGVVDVADPEPAAPRQSVAGDDVRALLAAAEARLESGEIESARSAAAAAIQLRPHEARAHLLLGRAHLAQGRFQEAIDECRRALRLDAQLADAHRWFGFALAGAGKFREARESFDLWDGIAGDAAGAAVREKVTAARVAVAALERQMEALLA